MSEIKCIVKENGFQVKVLNQIEDNSVLINGTDDYYWEKFKTYKIVKHNIDVYWGTKNLKKDTLIISYEDIVLNRIEQPTFQIVIDYLNMYNDISEEDLKKAVLKAQQNEKTELELEIEIIKSKLLVYKKAEAKVYEIKKLLSELEN